MKKLPLCFLLLLSLILVAFTDNHFSHTLDDFKLGGKLKSVTDTITCTSFAKKKYGCYKQVNFQEFDKKGNIIYHTNNFEGVLGSDNYTYSKNGDTIIVKSESYKTCFWETIYIYDSAKNLCLKDIYTQSNVRQTPCRFEFHNDSVVTEYGYDEFKKLICRKILKFDAGGNVIENSWFDMDGNFESRYMFQYNSKGYMTKEIVYDFNLELVAIITVAYNNNNDVVEEDSYKSDSSIFEKKVYMYEYDANKNWTKQEIAINDTLYSTTIRQIEYYK